MPATRPRAAIALGLWSAAVAALLVPVLVRAQAGRQEAIRLTMPSVVTVVAVDVVDGELQPMAGGSGTIVDSGGSVLTNHHVLYDQRRTRLYDLFLIGRFRAENREPELVCAGSPGSAMLRPDVDLALIRCDLDLNGQPWWPENWPAVPLGDSKRIVPGEQVWVLGYPSAGGGAIRVSAGLVSGWSGEHGGADSRAFMRTDAAISAGNSGGTAADRFGRLIGVPTAFRALTAERGGMVTAIGKVGLIRPIELAHGLLAAGRHAAQSPTDSPAEPSREDEPLPPDPQGQRVLVSGIVTDASSLQPIRGAFVIALPAGSDAGSLDGSALGELVVAWSQTDATGRFILEPSLARGQRYTVGVTAPGYIPALEISSLEVPPEGIHHLLPWQMIRLQRDWSI
ncbi:MAG TPA: trypsin-like peptidase domain-containing protein [Candidatus Acidoferrum sp.]|nr:trypsin-like peptidase domain-containing protein [Candidatus Acidoferrum sp.]